MELKHKGLEVRPDGWEEAWASMPGSLALLHGLPLSSSRS